MRLSGKTAIVTGSGRGIGRAIAIALAKEGCKVVICSRTQKEIDSVAKEIKKAGYEALAVKVDVSNPDDVKNMVAKTLEKFGSVDILVNNAGISVYKMMLQTTEEEYENVMSTNLKGVFLCIKEALPHMIRQRNGVIINISSVLGRHGSKNFSVYSASKFGVIGLTESISEELPEGIKIYAVCPGGVATRMQNQMFKGKRFMQRVIGKSKYMAAKHFKLIMKPERVAEKVLELCMPECELKSGASVEMGK